MDQSAAKKLLSELAKREDLENRSCADCGNPNPQWASLGFAILVCLQCAGTHRGFGVHISFVRSISMDTWQDEQLKRMQIGGNKPFKSFIASYPDSGLRADSSPHDKYHSWAAAQYKEKLDAALAGRNWSPAPAPPGYGLNSRSSSPAPSAAGLRKSRTSARSGLGVTRSNSQTPSNGGSRSTTPIPGDQKAQNEAYFASLGRANEARPDNLPPSQGGKYTGFGSTPAPSESPSFALSSANAPSLSELQENPVAALSKGWSLFAAAVVGAGKAVSENVIQPGVEKVTDPNFQATVRGYVTEAQKKAAIVGSSANEWSKQSFGVDVADTVGGVARAVGGGPSRAGYGQLSMTSPNEFHDTSSSALYDPRDDDDFFHEYDHKPQPQLAATSLDTGSFGSTAISRSASNTGSISKAKKAPAKKEDDWDEWKDF